MTDDFNSRLDFLSYKEIKSMYDESKLVELNNVLEDFESDFYSISFDDNRCIDDYLLIYVGRYGSIRGLTFNSGRNLEDRDFNTLRFAKAIENEFPEKNSIAIFNIFQTKLKQVYESFGVVCIPEYIANQETHKIFLLSKLKNSVDYLILIDPVKFYKSFFERQNKISDEEGIFKLYLMLEGENGYIKIGQTQKKLEVRRKGVAEPTLKAKDPKIYILSAWVAPKEVEKKLHLDYKSKRKRGEWFDLRAIDLQEINEMMLTYEMIEILNHKN
ncbi:MAG: GIY-YIG nuclease family protein [Paludibacter sp.]